MPRQNIVQRRANGGSSSTALPITNNDVESSGKRTRHRRRKLDPYDRNSLIRWVILIVISMAAAAFLWKPIMSLFGLKVTQSASSPGHDNRRRREQDSTSTSSRKKWMAWPKPHSMGGPLSKFSDLTYALQNSDLLALYFAASWCPMSTPVSLALDGAFGKNDVLLTHEGGARKTLSVVYVSSDKTPQEYYGYIHDRNWMAIPFESSQRSDIKRHFSTCAHRELEELGIDRKHEIPTIIVIDTRSQGIITTEGADDVDQLGEGALEHWKDIQKRVRRNEEVMLQKKNEIMTEAYYG